MAIYKITKYAFNLADIMSWLIIILIALSLPFAFIGPSISMWSNTVPPPTYVLVLEFLNTLLNGIGFYLLIKRKPIGFAFVVVTGIIATVAIRFHHIYHVYYLLIILFILALPWFLGYQEILNAKTKET